MRNKSKSVSSSMHFGYWWLNPLDVFESVAATYPPFSLDLSRRHPSRGYVALFRLTWNAQETYHRTFASGKTFMAWDLPTQHRGQTRTNLTWEIAQTYHLRRSIVHLAGGLIRQVLPSPSKESLESIAVRYCLDNELWSYAMDGRLYHYKYHGGAGCAEYGVERKTGKLIVRCGDAKETFAISHIQGLIHKELSPQPKQLLLLA